MSAKYKLQKFLLDDTIVEVDLISKNIISANREVMKLLTENNIDFIQIVDVSSNTVVTKLQIAIKNISLYVNIQ